MEKELVYIACPYCSHAIGLPKFRRTTFNINPLEFFILTKREQRSDIGVPRGSGKGHRGFYKIEGSGKTIKDLLNGTEEETQIAKKIIERVKLICAAYKEVEK